MTYGYRSNNSSRFSRSNFRSSRGRGSSFRGRGRGSDSSYHSSSRDSYSDRSSYRGSSHRGSSFHSRDDHYDSRGSSSRYTSDKFSSSRGRKDEGSSFHRRDIRESSSGSYGRDHSRRSDGESDRKRVKSEIGGSFKEGVSPRRSYDDLDHSSRGFSGSNSSPYRSNSNLFGSKSTKKEFNDFKKPLPPDHTSYSSRRPSRGARGRGTTSRISTTRILKVPSTAYLKHSTVSRMKTTSRLQQILRKKKQLRIMRMRKDRESRLNSSSSGKSLHKDDSKFSSVESDAEGMDEDVEMDEDSKSNSAKSRSRDSSADRRESRKSPKKFKKDSHVSTEKSSSPAESSKLKERNDSTRPDYRVPLKCIHCKVEYKTFKAYHHHLITAKHKMALEKLLFNLKQKLRRLRNEQREEQRIIDERDDNFNRTSYCKLCKLNFKQTRQEHLTSDFHISMSEFLNTKCSICRMSFNTPILYEHHRCTISHMKRKAFLEKKGALDARENEEDANEDESFMVLDSVGSADESSDETEADASVEGDDSESVTKKKQTATTRKKTTIIGDEYIKKVSIYYCKLCKLCLHYNPNRDQEESLHSHCRTRFHLKRFSMEEAKKNREATQDSSAHKETEADSEKPPGVDEREEKFEDAEGEENDKFWGDDEETKDDHKLSEDEDDSQSGNRYDRFSTSDEKDNADKVKVEPEEISDQNKNDAEVKTAIKTEESGS